jgi:hypothetical protein
MPAKKSALAPKAQGSNDWAKWVYLVGVIVAGLLGAFGKVLNLSAQISMVVSLVLILAGILAGIFFLDSGDVVNFGIRVLLLGAVSKALDSVPAIGTYISGFFGGVFNFFLPVGLTLLVMYFWKKYFENMM